MFKAEYCWQFTFFEPLLLNSFFIYLPIIAYIYIYIYICIYIYIYCLNTVLFILKKWFKCFYSYCNYYINFFHIVIYVLRLMFSFLVMYSALSILFEIVLYKIYFIFIIILQMPNFPQCYLREMPWRRTCHCGRVEAGRQPQRPSADTQWCSCSHCGLQQQQQLTQQQQH